MLVFLQRRVFSAGNRQPVIRWSKVGGDLPDGHSAARDGTLRIARVSVQDAGRYQCTADGEYSRTQEEVELFILS